jgi:hypothetical protein
MSDQNFNQSIKHFCGESKATGLFMEANYHGNNYTIPFNTPNEPELLYGKSLENIMFAKNYKQSAKQNGMADNDVHNQYIDFIVRTALFHRELDNPTLVGSGLESIRNSLKEGLDAQLLEKLRDLKGVGNLNSLLDSRAWIEESVGGKGVATTQINNVTLRSVGINENSSFYEYLNAVIVFLSLSILEDDVTGDFPVNEYDVETADVLFPMRLHSRKGSKSSKAANAIDQFKNVLRKVAGACDTAGNLGTNDIFGNLCLVSKFNGSSPTNASQNIDALLAKSKSGTSKAMLMGIMMNKMVRELLNYSMLLHRELGGLSSLIPNYFNLPDDASKIQMIKRILKQLADNKNLEESLKMNLLAAMFDVVKGTINAKSNDLFTTLDKNSHAMKLFEDVFLNWQNLNRDAREFYRVHLHIFRQVGSVLGQSPALPSSQNGWEDIGDRVEDANFLRSLQRNEIRINLMKERAGSADVLFGKTLPFLPVSGQKAVRNVWYTPAGSNVPQSIQANNLTETFLQDLYSCVYNGRKCVFNGITLILPSNFSQVESNTSEFDIEDILVIKNFISSRKQASLAPQQPVNQSFDALFVEDMVSHVVYRRNSEGNLYRIENGTKVPYSVDEISIDNCVGSRLGGDKLQCSRLVRECLMSGDKDALNNCIGSLRDANMFNVAQSECEHVDPHVAIQILRTFGVGRVITKDPIFGEISAPQSFEHWKEKTVSGLKPALREAILTDNKLCDYLKGIIAFVTMNPAILNKHISQDNKASLANQPIDDPYITSLKKTMYINPYQSEQEKKLFTAQTLTKLVKYPQISVTSPAHLTNPFNNVTYGGNAIGVPAYHSLSGGASSREESVMRKLKRDGPTSQLIETLMDNLFEEMKNGGIPLNEVDHARIKDGIRKLAHGEQKLAKYYSMLRALTDLALFFKSSGCVPGDGEVRELSLETIKNRSDTLAYLYQNIGDVQNCISDGIDKQNSKCKELVDFYSTLVNNQNNDSSRMASL